MLTVDTRVIYFDGSAVNPSDAGTVLSMSDDGKCALIRWDNGITDACECPERCHTAAKPDCKGEWFGVRDLILASDAEQYSHRTFNWV